jgi:hypothetical protein
MKIAGFAVQAQVILIHVRIPPAAFFDPVASVTIPDDPI